jgi:virginiamycin B lyase
VPVLQELESRLVPSTLNRFPLPPHHTAASLTAGPDGNVWFVDQPDFTFAGGHDGMIGRITPDGQITEFPVPIPPDDPNPNGQIDFGGMTAGPDDNLWFLARRHVPFIDMQGFTFLGRITPDGQISEFQVRDNNSNNLFPPLVGPDGNIWFYTVNVHADPRQLEQELSLDGSTITDVPFFLYTPLTSTDPSGNLWTSTGLPGVRYLSPDGQDLIPTVNLARQGAAEVLSLTAGADGNAYAVTSDRDEGIENPRLWQITPDGQATPFQVPEVSAGPAVGPDGNIWYATSAPTQLNQFTPDGSTTSFPLPISTISGITTGPDGNLWLIGGFNREIDQFILDGGGAAPGTRGPGSNHAAADVVFSIAGTESLRWEVASQQPAAGVDASFSQRESEAVILARGQQVPADGSALAPHPHHVRAGATEDAGLTDALAATL